jgi:hypothetical protein
MLFTIVSRAAVSEGAPGLRAEQVDRAQVGKPGPLQLRLRFWRTRMIRAELYDRIAVGLPTQDLNRLRGRIHG